MAHRGRVNGRASGRRLRRPNAATHEQRARRAGSSGTLAGTHRLATGVLDRDAYDATVGVRHGSGRARSAASTGPELLADAVADIDATRIGLLLGLTLALGLGGGSRCGHRPLACLLGPALAFLASRGRPPPPPGAAPRAAPH